MAVYLGNNKLTFDGISEIYVWSNKVYSSAIDYSTEYFFVENLTSSANNLSIKKSDASAPTITVYRSTNKNSWTSMGSTSTTALTYSIPANSKVYLKATTNNWGTSYYNTITCSGNFAVGGNTMSLLYGDSFIGKTVFPTSSIRNLSGLFNNSTNLKNIDNLVLPATTLTERCYSFMFNGCTGLTNVPNLPATTLADYCYSMMFSSCTGITSIPSNFLPATTLTDYCYQYMLRGTSITTIPSNLLPATTLTDYCYQYMFLNCTGLTKSPELPATTLTEKCYYGMFSGCSSLNEITCYANDISATNCTTNWVNGVSSSGTFYQKGTASWTTGTNGIPSGWSVDVDPINDYFYVENLTSSANTLSIKKNNASAPTITVYRSTDKTSWSSMGSTSTTALTYSIPANSKIYLRATVNNWSTGSYYNSITCSGNHAIGGNIMSLIYGSSFIGKTVFPTSSTYNLSRIFYNSTNLKNIDNLVLPATTLTEYCYYFMFYFCTGLTSIPSNLLPATTLADSCYYDMFNGCEGLTTIPSDLLPATTLANNCYNSMFSGTGLTSIPSNFLPATILADSCYSYMFSWSTGLTSVPSDLLPATTLASGCYSGMFSGCTGLTKAPELPATTLVDTCYQGMFRNSRNLNEITCYADDISAFWCTKDWLNGVAASGDFYQGGTASWTLDSVDGIPTGWTVKTPILKYFYVENLTNSANTLSIKKSNASAPTITVYYSVDKTTWVSMGDTDTTEITYTIPAESKVYLKATADSWCTSSYYNSITCSDNYAVGDNIMSLLYGDNFTGKTVFPTNSSYNLSRLFYNSTYLKNIDNLVLPATTLTSFCYQNMFYGCTGITSIPSNFLPATTLVSNCYAYMFRGCTSLTTIPSNLLPATTLSTGCYQNMFYGCTGLTTIPNLPATTLANNCYTGIFRGCTGLTSIPSNLLPATTLVSRCYSTMFYGCTGLTTLPSNLLPATTLVSYCYYNMFYGCTSLTKSPELPATTLTDSCYSSMFKNCSSLNEITCYANDISASNCTTDWVNGVAATGTFYKKGTASWVIDSVDGVPTGWTVIEEIPYDPINDYFWVENTSNASKQVCFSLLEVYKSDPWSSLQEIYGSGTLYYSTNKTSWSTISTNTYGTIIYLTVPAKTRYYLYMSWSTYGSTYSSFDYTYGGTANIYGWGAYISWSNNATGRCSSVFKPVNSSDNDVFAIGGNIRTITGSGQSGVSSTTQNYYDRSYYYKANSYTNVRYWTGLGKSTDSVISNQSQSGLYFQYIKDASKLYIGSTDVRPDFLNSGPNFVGPIYT